MFVVNFLYEIYFLGVFNLKKWIFSLLLIMGILSLSGCGDNAKIAETKSGDITKDQFYEELKDKYGESVLQEMVYKKVLSDKYKVSDKEVDAELNKLKDQYGDSYEQVLAQNQITEKQLRENITLNLLANKAAMKNVKVTDKELQDYYEKNYPEIKARHILVNDEKTAKEVKAKLDKGEKFEDLAKEYSQDPGSAQNGGDLGYFGPSTMVEEFTKAAFALKENEISAPVKSDNGYHIIQVLDIKKKPAFEDVKKEITEKVKKSKIEADSTLLTNTLQSEVKNADVKISDKDLKDLFSTKSAASNETK